MVSFHSKGEAIALALATTAERSVADQTLTTVQSSIDSNRLIQGVKYIYIVSADGTVRVHTFSPSFPTGLQMQNQIRLGEQLVDAKGNPARVQTDDDVTYTSGGEDERAIDVAAPVAGGALGTVHVGMDPALIRGAGRGPAVARGRMGRRRGPHRHRHRPALDALVGGTTHRGADPRDCGHRAQGRPDAADPDPIQRRDSGSSPTRSSRW